MQCYINIDQVSISYLEHNPQASQTIFFVHGNSASARVWMSQLNSQLLTNHRLIALDLPAHGRSDALPSDRNDYNITSLGRIMALAVDRLHQGKPYILAGLSIGTNVIAEMLYHSARPEALVIIGSCIVGGEVTFAHILHKDADVQAGFSDEPSDEALFSYLKNGIHIQKAAVLQDLASDFRHVKDHFRSKLAQAIATSQYSNEIQALQNYNMPLLVIFGEEEKVIDIQYMDAIPLPLWCNKIHIIAQAGHFPNLDQPEQVNILIAQLADDVFK